MSCLHGFDESSEFPPLTAHYVMRVGALPLVPYFPSDDLIVAKAVHEMASNHRAVLLANHGPVVAGKSLADAAHAAEELEETAKMYLALQGMRTRPLTQEKVAEFRRRFPTDTGGQANDCRMRHLQDQDRNDERLRGTD